MNARLKSGLTQKNVTFHTLLKPPKVSVSSILTCACSHCRQTAKMLGCETFPEFNTVPLDRESHSFSICLRIPNHRMWDKSMLHINSCKLQMENTGNLCSSYLLWVWNIKDLLISPLVDSQTTRCFSCWEHEMRLHEKNKQNPKLFQNPQCTGRKHQMFGKPLPSILFTFF